MSEEITEDFVGSDRNFTLNGIPFYMKILVKLNDYEFQDNFLRLRFFLPASQISPCFLSRIHSPFGVLIQGTESTFN